MAFSAQMLPPSSGSCNPPADLLKNGLFVSRTRRLLENRRKLLKQEQQTGEGLRAWSTITPAMDAAAKDTETAFAH